MAFSSANDSIEILLKCRVEGESAIKSLGGSASSLDQIIKNLDASLQRHAAILQQSATSTHTLNTSIGTLNSTIQAGTTATAGFTNSLGILGNPISALNSPLQVLGRGIQSVASSMGTVGIAGIAAGVGFAFLAKSAIDLVNSQAQASRELANFAARLDISVGTAQRLQFQAALTGVNIGTLEQSVRTLSNALADPTGSGAKQVEVLNRLGISTHDLNGETKELGPLIEEVLGSLGGLSSAAERAHDGQVLLGRSSKELLPLIEQYEETKKAAEKFAASLDANAIAKLEEARRATSELGIAFDILKKNLSAKIAPIEIAIVRTITTLVKSDDKNDSHAKGYLFGIPLDQDFGKNNYDAIQGFANAANAKTFQSLGNPADALIQDNIKRAESAGLTPAQRLQAQLSAVDKSLPGLKAGVGETAASLKPYQDALATKASLEAQIAGLHANTEALKAFQYLLKERDAGADKRSFGDGPLGRLLGARDADLRKNADVANAAGKSSSQLDSDTDAQYVNQIGDVFRKYREEAVKAAKKDVSEYAKEAAKPANFDDKEFLKNLTGSTKVLEGQQAIANRTSQVNANDQVQVLKDQFSKTSAINSAKFSDDPYFAQNLSLKEQISLAQQIFAIRLDELTTAKELATIGGDQRASDQADLDLAKARKDLDDETEKAQLQRTLDGLNQQKKDLDSVKSSAGSIFDSLTEKGGRGLSTYIQAQGKQIEKQLFENTAGIAYQSLGGSGTGGIGSILPGQRDEKGQLTTFGKFLDGTILGSKGNNPQIDAQKDNTKAVIDLTSVLSSVSDEDPGSGSGSGSGGGFSIPGIGRIGGSAGGLFKLFGGGSSGSSGGFLGGSTSSDGFNINDLDPGSSSSGGGGSSAGSSLAALSKFKIGSGSGIDLQGILTGVGTGPGGTGAQSFSTAERLGGAAVTGGAVLGSTLGAVSSFSKGGLKNDTQGVADVLGGISAVANVIPGGQIIGAALGIAALGTSLVSAAFGDGRTIRSKQEAATIHNSQYSQALDNPTQNQDFDISGNAAYTNSSGNNQIVNHNYTIQVQALDASSIIQRASDISDALHVSINNGHPVVNAINNLSA